MNIIQKYKTKQLTPLTIQSKHEIQDYWKLTFLMPQTTNL